MRMKIPSPLNSSQFSDHSFIARLPLDGSFSIMAVAAIMTFGNEQNYKKWSWYPTVHESVQEDQKFPKTGLWA